MAIPVILFETKLNEVMLKKANCELGEDEARRQQVIAIIRQWMAKQPHLHQIGIDDYGIVCFARGCKYSVEKMKSKIDLMFTLRTALPEFFSGWDPMRPEIQAALACGSFLPLPGHDQHGRKVIVVRPGCYDPYRFKPEDIEKASFMISEVMVLEDEQMFVTGMVIVYDCHGYTLNHVTQRPLSLSKKHMSYLQSAPLSPKTIHVIRTNSVFQTVYNVMSSMVNDKMKRRLRIHGDDLESLYQEVGRKVLPNDYGGEEISLEKLTDCWKLKVEEKREFLMESEKKWHVDESRRPGKAKTAQDIFGIEGSFRKLNVD